MAKNFTTLILFLFCSSCFGVQPLCDIIYQNKSFSIKTKKILCGDGVRTGFGAQHYKYRCKKSGDCCEVGKDCKEDLKNKKSEK